jgi:catechol 2,3-dioxygenase-like lactoylglutathione lyase family enzyme
MFYSLGMAVARERLEVVEGRRGIDHVTVTTRDCRAAKRFYELALSPLGFSVVFDWPEGGRAYLGLPSETSSLWLVQGDARGRIALTLAAADRRAVDAFYAAALAAGAEPVALPGFRPDHTPSTYAAEVLDPEGNAVEALCWHAKPIASAAEIETAA